VPGAGAAGWRPAAAALEDQGYHHTPEVVAAIEAKNPHLRWSEMELSD